jgi:hypothetical protein
MTMYFAFLAFFITLHSIVIKQFFFLIGVEETVCALLSQYRNFHEVKGRNLYGDR